MSSESRHSVRIHVERRRRAARAADRHHGHQLVVGGALASRDYMPVHHDKAAAQAQGMQDVFMNILTTNGLVGRYVTDWAGTRRHLRGIASSSARRTCPATR